MLLRIITSLLCVLWVDKYKGWIKYKSIFILCSSYERRSCGWRNSRIGNKLVQICSHRNFQLKWSEKSYKTATRMVSTLFMLVISLELKKTIIFNIIYLVELNWRYPMSFVRSIGTRVVTRSIARAVTRPITRVVAFHRLSLGFVFVFLESSPFSSVRWCSNGERYHDHGNHQNNCLNGQ